MAHMIRFSNFRFHSVRLAKDIWAMAHRTVPALCSGVLAEEAPNLKP